MNNPSQQDGGSAYGGNDLDSSRPHSARMYDYFLGGKDNYLPDRQAAGKVLAAWPSVMVGARTNRAFMHRATRLLAERGIRQFLDIGTGIPTRPNLHEVAQGVAPEARVVYADFDPIVLRQAQALLSSTAEGRTSYVQADVTDPATLLAAPELNETLDFSQPVALSLNALLHFVADEHRPYDIVQQLVGALAPGSYLSLSHVTTDADPETLGRVQEIYHSSGINGKLRTKPEVEEFFTGLELLEPGVEMAHRWRPSEDPEHQVVTGHVEDAEVSVWAGVARKP
ncbi:SAM-dependent methyltransferase [Streptomyces sp. N2-109]|uniref:SAM-dependent methyltransferase n=1 Tax=Streptomyces gossypii TaxID=2883101 RepID=A0ABT2JSY7_9ACTN|nr:SAM-dependent methyltransferase [Streptomyces gossypii]MCT2590999.1 SAM-dependent methyltransferase [Streptomyces gossypii]